LRVRREYRGANPPPRGARGYKRALMQPNSAACLLLNPS